LAALAAATAAPAAALLLPPFLAHPESLAGKAGIDRPGIDTFVGVWYTWLGTPSTMAMLACCVLALIGARGVWRALPVARTGVLGITLTLAAVLATGPAWSYNPLTLARYLLPFLPLLLIAVAAGAVALARHRAVPAQYGRNSRRVARWRSPFCRFC
jgi:hypothetical protein